MPSDVPEIIVPTRQGYDRWSEVYDSYGNPLVVHEEPEVIRMMGEVRGLSIVRTLARNRPPRGALCERGCASGRC